MGAAVVGKVGRVAARGAVGGILLPNQDDASDKDTIGPSATQKVGWKNTLSRLTLMAE